MITIWLQSRNECFVNASRCILVLLAILIIIINEGIYYMFILIYISVSCEFCQHVSVSLNVTDSRMLSPCALPRINDQDKVIPCGPLRDSSISSPSDSLILIDTVHSSFIVYYCL